MIAEALNYAATLLVTPRPFRPFIRYSINLWSRARRCSRQWADHEAMTRTAILDTARHLKQRRTAVILGSGLLRDVPVVELSRLFDTVVLVDLVHPASTRTWLKLRGLKNTRLISRDLSGYEDMAQGMAPEPMAFLRQVPYLDFVVSANLLSQVAIGVGRKFDSDTSSRMPPDTVQQLVSAHIAGLRALPCASCLVTDIAYRVTDRNGHLHEETDLLRGVTPPASDSAWDWPVVPFGEESGDYQVVHRVISHSTIPGKRRPDSIAP